MNRPAIFFDRDGVLNYDKGYTYKVVDLAWRSGAREAVKLANDLGYLTFVVSNQSGVARGLYSEQDVHNFHHAMQKDLFAIGAHIDEFCFCPHSLEGTHPEYSKSCSFRKPNPGMLHYLLDKWPIAKQKSFLIGDKASDIEAANRAEISGHLVKDDEPLDKFLKGLAV